MFLFFFLNAKSTSFTCKVISSSCISLLSDCVDSAPALPVEALVRDRLAPDVDMSELSVLSIHNKRQPAKCKIINSV